MNETINNYEFGKQLIFLRVVQLRIYERGNEKSWCTTDLFFQAQISPAFDEHAAMTILKIDSIHTIQFLLRDAYGSDEPSDTFYFKTAALSESQFHKVDTELLQKVITGYSIQNTGIRDGIRVGFTIVHNGNSSNLSFDNPQKGIDTAAFEIIKNWSDNFQTIFNDTITNDYLDYMLTYIDNSKRTSPLKGKRTIDKARRIKYSL